MTAALVSAPSRRFVVLRRVGVVLAVLQAVLIAANVLSDFGTEGLALVVNVATVVCAVGVLATTVPAWLGIRPATVVAALAVVVLSLTGLPAFFLPGIPTAFVIVAAAGIVVAVGTAVLLLVRPRL